MSITIDLTGLEPVELPFKWRGKDYVLCEPSEPAHDAYMAEMMRAAKPDMGTFKPTSVDGIPEVEARHLARCIFEVRGEQRVPVPFEFVCGTKGEDGTVSGGLPHRIVEHLKEKLKEIDGDATADAKAAEAALKNGSSATARTSA